MDNELIIEAFTNFLGRAGQPSTRTKRVPGPRPWPPAVWGYVLGATPWCPPDGEL